MRHIKLMWLNAIIYGKLIICSATMPLLSLMTLLFMHSLQFLSMKNRTGFTTMYSCLNHTTKLFRLLIMELIKSLQLFNILGIIKLKLVVSHPLMDFCMSSVNMLKQLMYFHWPNVLKRVAARQIFPLIQKRWKLSELVTSLLRALLQIACTLRFYSFVVLAH